MTGVNTKAKTFSVTLIKCLRFKHILVIINNCSRPFLSEGGIAELLYGSMELNRRFNTACSAIVIFFLMEIG